jgi:type VI secretion system protein ImpG
MLQGQRIKLEANREHYASMGNLLLFCSVLDHFFGAYSAMHTFTQTEVRETVTGEVLTWPSRRMGARCLV